MEAARADLQAVGQVVVLRAGREDDFRVTVDVLMRVLRQAEFTARRRAANVPLRRLVHAQISFPPRCVSAIVR